MHDLRIIADTGRARGSGPPTPIVAALAQEQPDYMARGSRVRVHRRVAAVIEPPLAEGDYAVG
jgi:hypothetical protein